MGRGKRSRGRAKGDSAQGPAQPPAGPAGGRSGGGSRFLPSSTYLAQQHAPPAPLPGAGYGGHYTPHGSNPPPQAVIDDVLAGLQPLASYPSATDYRTAPAPPGAHYGYPAPPRERAYYGAPPPAPAPAPPPPTRAAWRSSRLPLSPSRASPLTAIAPRSTTSSPVLRSRARSLHPRPIRRGDHPSSLPSPSRALDSPCFLPSVDPARLHPSTRKCTRARTRAVQAPGGDAPARLSLAVDSRVLARRRATFPRCAPLVRRAALHRLPQYSSRRRTCVDVISRVFGRTSAGSGSGRLDNARAVLSRGLARCRTRVVSSGAARPPTRCTRARARPADTRPSCASSSSRSVRPSCPRLRPGPGTGTGTHTRTRTRARLAQAPLGRPCRTARLGHCPREPLDAHIGRARLCRLPPAVERREAGARRDGFELGWRFKLG